uniref:Uncharacterized protein n=1 Tax=Oryza punctata TaxID=4537 RepID=A0A0E0LXH9_ORYPU
PPHSTVASLLFPCSSRHFHLTDKRRRERGVASSWHRRKKRTGEGERERERERERKKQSRARGKKESSFIGSSPAEEKRHLVVRARGRRRRRIGTRIVFNGGGRDYGIWRGFC